MIYYGISLLIIIIDRITKWFIVNHFELKESRSVIGNFFLLTSHRNSGAAFGILQNQRWLFLIITVVVVAGIIWYMQRMIKEQKVLLPVALGLLLGGALGNFYDRLMTGEVVDFLQFNFIFTLFKKDIDYTFAIFNIADSAIVIGVALIFIDTFIANYRHKREVQQ